MLGVFTKKDVTSGAVDGDLATTSSTAAVRHFNLPGDPVVLPFDKWKPLTKPGHRRDCWDLEGGMVRKYTGWYLERSNGIQERHMIAEVLHPISRKPAGPGIKYKQLVYLGDVVTEYDPKVWTKRA